jgi:hypothetical protein
MLDMQTEMPHPCCWPVMRKCLQIELSKQKKLRRKRTKTNGEEFGQGFYSSNWGSVEPTSSVCGGVRAAAAS